MYYGKGLGGEARCTHGNSMPGTGGQVLRNLAPDTTCSSGSCPIFLGILEALPLTSLQGPWPWAEHLPEGAEVAAVRAEPLPWPCTP